MSAAAQKLSAPRCLVVGLLDRQFGIVRNEFPQLDLDHYKDGSLSTLSAMHRNADHVLVITKFISHAVWDHVPREKVAFFTGLAGLRVKLADIAASHMFRETATVLPFRLVTEDDDMGKPLCDYSGLRTAQPGDVLTFIRPEGVPAHVFKQDIWRARSYYKKHHGIESSSEISGGKAEVFILKAADHPKLEQAEIMMGEEAPVTFRLPSMDEMCRQFWRDAYVESFRAAPYVGAAHHAAIASAAVEGWRTVCGEGK